MASKNIAFDTIPASIRKPGKYFEFNTRMAVSNLPGNLQRVLLIGQKTYEGTQKELVPVQIFSDVQARDLFGGGSELHLMCKAALACNKYITMEAIAIKKGGYQSNSKKITVSTVIGFIGTNVTAKLEIGNTVLLGAFDLYDTAFDIVAYFCDLINKTIELPVTCSMADDGQGLIFYTKKVGEDASDLYINLSVLSSTPASALVIIQDFGWESSFFMNPDIQPALDVVYTAGHNIIVSPYIDTKNSRALRNHLESVSSSMEQRGAIGVLATNRDIVSATLYSRNINSGRVTIGWHSGSKCSNGEIAAAYASQIAFEEDPARPLNTLAMNYLDETDVGDQPGRVEQEAALHNGVTPFEVGPGGRVQIVRAVTTYTYDPQYIEDVSLLDLTTIRTLDYVRKAVRERVSLRFPREKLSDRTPARVRSEILDVLFKLQDLEIVEQVEENKPNLIVERDLQDANRLDAAIPSNVVNGLHVFAGRIDLYL